MGRNAQVKQLVLRLMDPTEAARRRNKNKACWICEKPVAQPLVQQGRPWFIHRECIPEHRRERFLVA